MKLTKCSLLILILLLSPWSNATTFAGDATLAWDPPTVYEDGTPLTDIADYRIYYGTTSRSYSQAIDVGKVVPHTVAGLAD